jgi:uncharacterized phage protein (TIGR01671 family)
MSREIKFRAWNGKEVKQVDQITIGENTWSCENGYGVSIPYQPSIILMQYTGLKDKNGKEIYEGDIVKGIFSIRTGTRSNGRGRNAYTYAVYSDIEVIGFVVFNELLSSFYFETDFKQEYLTSFWRGCGRTKAERDANYLTTTYDSPRNYLHKVLSKIEVIGNIYENIELLNQ